MIQYYKYIVLRDENNTIIDMWPSRAEAARALGVTRQTIANHLPNENARNPKKSNKFDGKLSEEMIAIDMPTAEELFINLEGEEWKPVNGFENYEISNCGRLRKNYVLRELTGTPYLHTTIGTKGNRQCVLIHRLVAEHFLPDWNPQLVVNHKDENKTNNHVSNLEMMTIAENFEYSRNLHKEEWVAKAAESRKGKLGTPVKCIETGEIYPSIAIASETTGISRHGIGKCCRGEQKTSGDLHWEYVTQIEKNHE